MIHLWLWVGRRDDLAPGDIAMGHAREQTPTLIVLAGVLALETAVVGLLVPWPFVHVLDARIPLALVATARVERKFHSGRTVQLADGELTIVVGDQTDVLVTLSEPVTTPRGTAQAVRFRADDPAKAVRVIRGTVSESRR